MTNDTTDVLADPIRIAFRRLGVGHDKGYQLIRGDELRTFKIGNRRYMTRAAQLEFIGAREPRVQIGRIESAAVSRVAVRPKGLSDFPTAADYRSYLIKLLADLDRWIREAETGRPADNSRMAPR